MIKQLNSNNTYFHIISNDNLYITFIAFYYTCNNKENTMIHDLYVFDSICTTRIRIAFKSRQIKAL